MTPQKKDLLINCPICNKIPYYFERHGAIKCKTCAYYYYLYENNIDFSIKFNRKNEIVYVDITYDKLYLRKYLYKIRCVHIGINRIDFESDIFLNKKQINKIIDNQIFS